MKSAKFQMSSPITYSFLFLSKTEWYSLSMACWYSSLNITGGSCSHSNSLRGQIIPAKPFPLTEELVLNRNPVSACSATCAALTWLLRPLANTKFQVFPEGIPLVAFSMTGTGVPPPLHGTAPQNLHSPGFGGAGSQSKPAKAGPGLPPSPSSTVLPCQSCLHLANTTTLTLCSPGTASAPYSLWIMGFW